MRALRVVASLVFTLTGVATAQIVSQPLNPIAGSFSNDDSSVWPDRIADNFAVAGSATITAMTWWGHTSDPLFPNTGRDLQNLAGFHIRFYENSGGLPGALVTALPVALLDVTIDSMGPEPASPFGGTFHRFDVSFAPAVALPAAGTYWVSVTGDLAASGGPLFTWGRTAAPAIAVGARNATGVGAWSAGPDIAMQLSGSVNFDSDGDGLLDTTEIDIANGGGCPSPTNADSDGDGLSDGFEVLMLGTNPCDQDTDGDLIPDDIDPDPTSFDGASGLDYFANVVILNLDPGVFDAPNANAAEGRRGALANQVQAAAKRVEQGDIPGAIEKLQNVQVKIIEWIDDPATEAELLQMVDDLIAELL